MMLISSFIGVSLPSGGSGRLDTATIRRPLNLHHPSSAIALRDLMTDLRAADPFRQGGGRSFTKTDRSRFLDALELAVRRVAR
jgi:hypothetical protein